MSKHPYQILREVGLTSSVARALQEALTENDYEIRKIETDLDAVGRMVAKALKEANLDLVERVVPTDDKNDDNMKMSWFHDVTHCRKCNSEFKTPVPAVSMHSGMCAGDYCWYDPQVVNGD